MQQCFSCGISFSALSLTKQQAHLNECLDKAARKKIEVRQLLPVIGSRGACNFAFLLISTRTETSWQDDDDFLPDTRKKQVQRSCMKGYGLSYVFVAFVC